MRERENEGNMGVEETKILVKLELNCAFREILCTCANVIKKQQNKQKHPRSKWKNHFSSRDNKLKALSSYILCGGSWKSVTFLCSPLSKSIAALVH
jgi:hypothetical protein